MRCPLTGSLVVLALLVGSALQGQGPAECAKEAEAAVRALLAAQSMAWNRGDLAAFTAVYAEDAAFLSSTGLTRGRQQVLERYRRRYPDRKAMGTLSLEVLETRILSAEEAASPHAGGRPCRIPGLSVVARWRLAYPDQPDKKTAEGLTLLVFKPRGEGWEIVQDASM